MNGKPDWQAEWTAKKQTAYKEGKAVGFDLVGKGLEINCPHKEGSLLRSIYFSGVSSGVRMAGGGTDLTIQMRKLAGNFYAAWLAVKKKQKGVKWNSKEATQ